MLDHDHIINKLDRIISKKECRDITGVSETTWWRMEKAGLCPRRLQLSPGRVGYRLSEILNWNETRKPTQ